MIRFNDVNQLLTIIQEASNKLSYLVGELVELQIIKPALPEINSVQKLNRELELEDLKIKIIQYVCAQYMITGAQLMGNSRKRALSDARKTASHLLHTYVKNITDGQIADILECDRSTVIYNRRQAASYIKTDKAFAFNYTQITKQLQKTLKEYE